MPTTYTLDISKMRKRENDGFVEYVYWKKTGVSDDGIIASYDAISRYDNADPSTPGFIEFDKLTESDVLRWVTLDPVYTSCDSVIEQLIDKQRIRTAEILPPDFPWVADQSIKA